MVLATISAGLFIFFAAPGSIRAVVTNTGFLPATAQQAASAADGNSYEVNPTNAFADDGLFALDA